MNYESNEKACTVFGPWGGPNGVRWDDGIYNGVRQIVIYHGAAIESIQIEYDLLGTPVLSDKHGGSGGIKAHKVKLNFPDEYLVSVNGYYGSVMENGPAIVRSLTFLSNKKIYGPFGMQQGTYFQFPASSEMVVGFYGRSSWHLDSIGVYLKPVLRRNPTSDQMKIPESNKATIQDDSKVAANKVGKQTAGYGAVREVHLVRYLLAPYHNPFNMNYINSSIYGLDQDTPVIAKEEASTYMLGPWGGDGGKAWDDGEFAGIKKIYLTRGEAIYCIQVEYDRNGRSFWSVRNGGGSEGSSHTINFDYPDEVLTGICGYHDSFTGDARRSVVKSLTFITNKAKYGPYGEEAGTFFTSAGVDGRITGFHGRSGCYLNSIGVHLQQWSSDLQVQGYGRRRDGGGPVRFNAGKFFN